jgi:hypothetical protein
MERLPHLPMSSLAALRSIVLKASMTFIVISNCREVLTSSAIPVTYQVRRSVPRGVRKLLEAAASGARCVSDALPTDRSAAD